MASGLHNRWKANVMNKLIDMGNGGDAFKVALLDNSHSFDPDDNEWADVSANEIPVSGTGYSQKTLANQSVSQDDANDLAKFDADDVEWTTATFTAYHAVIFDDTLVNDDLVGSIDFGGAKSVTGGTFTMQWSANGIIRLS
jgi:hypothetical protein